MRLRPEHFDWLGFGAFIYFLAYGAFVMSTGDIPAPWATYLLVIFAGLGAIVDGTIVYRFFLKKKS